MASAKANEISSISGTFTDAPKNSSNYMKNVSGKGPLARKNPKQSSANRIFTDPFSNFTSTSCYHHQQPEPFKEDHKQKDEIKNARRKVAPLDKKNSDENEMKQIPRTCTKSDRSADGTKIMTNFDEEISTGLPSDLPSDLFDVAGDLVYGNIHNLRFGLEDDTYSSADENEFDNQGRERTRASRVKVVCAKEQMKNPCIPNKKQYKRSLPSSPSSTKASIFPTCAFSPQSSPTKNGTGATDAAIAVCDIRKSEPVNRSRNMIHRQNSVEDLCHPLLINGDIGKQDGRSAIRNYPSLVRAPRGKLIVKQSISSNSANNTSNTNSGNFSPPSDQFRSPFAPFDRHHSSGGASSNSSNTITQHYYPEGGWGHVVLFTCTICHILTCGLQLSFGILLQAILEKFGNDLHLISSWLGAVSLGISLLFSPVWVSICKKKSTRLSAVFGGLVASLGCLFTSFASQFHQTFISYGAFLGIGVGLSRDASSLMVGQYFKRKREMVEIIVVSGSGLGIILMSVAVHAAYGSLGWRLGLQAVTVSLILTFFLGTCYRSASLYHPQRRAILHLKNQKRKVKEKGKREDRPPFIDFSCLRSKTLRIILMSSACTAFGIFTPLLSLAVQCSKAGFEDCSLVLLHVYIGSAWVIGCCTLGLIVIQKNQDCRVSKQYLCQVASVICGISILALTAVKGTNGMVVFCWVYGASLGGYCYSLKVYTYERARARHFPRAWSFLQSSQAIPLFLGVPLSNYANEIVGWKSGYYMSAIAVFIGTACLFLTDMRRRKLSRRKSQNSSMKTCETTDGGTSSSPKSKRLSFAFPVEQLANQQHSTNDSDDEDEPGNGTIDPSVLIKELTCISEECLADIDFQNIYFDEWDEYIGECITSCNKVENCLVSEYDHDLAVMAERRARRWSAAKQNMSHQNHQMQMLSKGPGTTGRLTLPGIGTVLEVPLLVAKRLHPNVGVRSHHPQLVHGGVVNLSQHQVHQHKPQGGSSSGASCTSGDISRESATTSGGGFGPSIICSGDENQPGSSSASRIYHHGKNRAMNNHAVAMAHFPAIDEDSV